MHRQLVQDEAPGFGLFVENIVRIGRQIVQDERNEHVETDLECAGILSRRKRE